MDEEALFAAALECPTPAERRAFLDRACGTDTPRRHRQRVVRVGRADERLFTRAEIPARFISRATQLTQHGWPRATNSACIRGLPYRCRTSA